MPESGRKEINAKWLTDEFVIEVFGKDVTASDVNIEWAVNEGDNQVGDLYRLKCGDRSVIVKNLDTESLFITFSNELDMFRKEYDIYNVYMPMVSEITDTKMTPECYSVDGKLVLEDLSIQDYATKNRREMLDLHHSLGVIKALGVFHAAGVVILSKDPSNLETIRNPAYTTSKTNAAIMTKIMHAMCNVMKNWEEVEHLVERLQKYVENSYEYTAQEMLKPRKVSTIIHGDCHTHNILFRENEPDKPIFIDFQFTQEGEPVLDLIYFLMLSVKDEVLEEDHETLLKAYVESFNSALMEAQYSGPRTTVIDVKQRIDSYPHFKLHSAGTRMAVVLAKEGLQVTNNLLTDTVEEIFDENNIGKKRLVDIILHSAEIELF